ncbi:MAG TPA: tRNA (adenosine(37)-N6)-threonylcarbamoyltransferase complex dimerization subunit type 1 TsaB [Candidatus Saccharimonadales bacterium]|nr:tRNA (adenosine(37)-N6)-threonylcarbamoyltransferase complex dimerization subunit type 1 TsaB [Candidatus Saccharimonadales bacterium]
MLLLTIRTDKPQAEVGLLRGGKKLAYETWQAHRELSMTIHHKIESLLKQQGFSYEDLGGIVCFAGPGSFTGLRIGLSVGNAFAYALDIPIVATKGAQWIAIGSDKLAAGHPDSVAIPYYGAEAHTTSPRT